MKVLILMSGNFADPEKNYPLKKAFVYDQVQAIRQQGVEVSLFFIRGKGIIGYLRQVPKLRKAINASNSKLVHAHYGLAGLVAVLASPVPVVFTVHGSDVNRNIPRVFTALAAMLATHVIYVSDRLRKKAWVKGRQTSIIPCGVDFSVFYPEDQQRVRQRLGWNLEKKYILFASAFDNPVKNYPLAKKAVDALPFEVELVEIKNKTREEVRDLLNASDLLMMTSHSEGSPQIIKEALACARPIVSTDVGDVRERLEGIPGTYVVDSQAEKLRDSILKVYTSSPLSGWDNRMIDLDNRHIAKQLISLYQSLLS